ncbi:5-carboxymethyl-2-hydroxymuconate Delta-isomerase [Emcibacter sp.]|uniref:5-carboxymethyl-2-hydroxymuconate Delta-isomerase n=1 Tax=Emcibacter sp. TaxID=1979954 RepID=UPI002AA92EC6|nr:5-carboxymethyl-2-hydroxymuconate Delta-isomerase [Emcibacter sp.]
MPHFIVEYSANIEDELDLPAFLPKIRDKAVETGVFPLGGVRVRAARRDHYVVADGAPENAFVHVTARLREGRPFEVRKKAGNDIFQVICDYLQPIFDSRPLGISFEMQEIDMDFNFKKNNLHARMREKYPEKNL